MFECSVAAVPSRVNARNLFGLGFRMQSCGAQLHNRQVGREGPLGEHRFRAGALRGGISQLALALKHLTAIDWTTGTLRESIAKLAGQHRPPSAVAESGADRVPARVPALNAQRQWVACGRAVGVREIANSKRLSHSQTPGKSRPGLRGEISHRIICSSRRPALRSRAEPRASGPSSAVRAFDAFVRTAGRHRAMSYVSPLAKSAPVGRRSRAVGAERPLRIDRLRASHTERPACAAYESPAVLELRLAIAFLGKCPIPKALDVRKESVGATGPQQFWIRSRRPCRSDALDPDFAPGADVRRRVANASNGCRRYTPARKHAAHAGGLDAAGRGTGLSDREVIADPEGVQSDASAARTLAGDDRQLDSPTAQAGEQGRDSVERARAGGMRVAVLGQVLGEGLVGRARAEPSQDPLFAGAEHGVDLTIAVLHPEPSPEDACERAVADRKGIPERAVEVENYAAQHSRSQRFSVSWTEGCVASISRPSSGSTSHILWRISQATFR